MARPCDSWAVSETPAKTIYQWAGGTEAFERWLNAFYDLVEEDEGLAPLFGGRVSERHRAHVLAWWVEVMGGPATYSAEHGGYPAMLARHRGLAITPELRLRFVTLLSRAADLVELPSDHNSDPGADDITEQAPVPRWGWGVAPPYEG